MTAATHNITIEQGTDWALSMALKDGAGDPLDLTDATLRSMIRTPTAAGMKLIDITASVEGDAEDGLCSLVLTNEETSSIPAGDHVYDVELVRGDNVVRIMQGRARVSAEVTRG
jgi:hypothetical protein